MSNPIAMFASQTDTITSDSITLPDFSTIKASHFVPALEQAIGKADTVIQGLEAQLKEELTWENTMQPLDDVMDALEKTWNIVSHINAVRNDDEVRAEYAKGLEKLTAFTTELGQNESIFQKTKTLIASDDFSVLDQAKQKTLNNKLRDFRLSGIELSSDKREQFKQLSQKLAELCTTFSNNVLDATQSYVLSVTEETRLAGIPQAAIDAAAALAEKKSLQGWAFSLDMPAYLPVMQFADDAALREDMYLAYTTRASECGPDAGKFDNAETMQAILQTRQQLAKLLGFENYVEKSLATKMASSQKQVEDFLNRLAKESVEVGKSEYLDLCVFARENLDIDTLNAWDIPYAAEKLKQASYSVSQEEVREYFPVDVVIDGLFSVVTKLFNVQINVLDEFTAWHKDVKAYEICNNKGELVSQFYFDLFAREGKRGGAWMADLISRRKLTNGELQKPVAFMVCNFTAPSESRPSLLTHQEVTTLFHEFGHGLHHMLTAVDTSAVSGINGVPWDAVELPSQFLENWCWEKEVIPTISRHYQTGEPLPESLLNKMLAAKNFQSAMQMLRQLEFAMFDIAIHASEDTRYQAIVEKLAEVRAKVSVYPTPEYNRFANSFSHIFAGGYAAGYYSYKWAELLSADAFSAFEEAGIYDQTTGERFLQTILASGGSKEPEELFEAFRGRKPSIEPLLRHSGISKAA